MLMMLKRRRKAHFRRLSGPRGSPVDLSPPPVKQRTWFRQCAVSEYSLSYLRRCINSMSRTIKESTSWAKLVTRSSRIGTLPWLLAWSVLLNLAFLTKECQGKFLRNLHIVSWVITFVGSWFLPAWWVVSLKSPSVFSVFFPK